MSREFLGWEAVGKRIHQEAVRQRTIAEESGEDAAHLNPGQRASLVAIGKRIPDNGVVIADEVGMGKTRIAVEVVRAVKECGGRVAILIPPGLGYQWQAELQSGKLNDVPNILRSIAGYLGVWSEENEASPWFETPVVLVSHAFANWRLSGSSAAWRWAVVPELYARWRERRFGRLPRGYHGNEALNNGWSCQDAAKSIVDSVSRVGSPAGKLLDRLIDIPWPSPTDASNYSKGGNLRSWLEKCVGLGLGNFDLVIVDEAHKSRKTGSGLSRLLNNILLPDGQRRTIGLTATPVELGIEQWSETLARIGLSKEQLKLTQTASEKYASAVYRIRRAWRSNQGALEEFRNASKQFESALSPYLIRRDKREDPAVIQFQAHSKLPYHAYRHEQHARVQTESLGMAWKSAICAAESLSVVTTQADDRVAKRLRLTLGNGHAVSTILGQKPGDDELGGQAKNAKPIDVKRKARAQWWMKVIGNALELEDYSLFNHPAILKAVEVIEAETERDKKVLVFGRFTDPMLALVNLLNAREMLRRLERDQPWPQAKVHGSKTDPCKPCEKSEWPAARAAHKQLSCSIPIGEIDQRLAKAYGKTQVQRRKFRHSIVAMIESGLADLGNLDLATRMMFDAFKRSADGGSEDNNSLAVVSRAILSLHGALKGLPEPVDCAKAFVELIAAASDKDSPDNDDPDEEEISYHWDAILERLAGEYNRPEGGFARLMYGGTTQDSRRMIQLAFNRQGSFPRVLVAQSLVGREGLNLHKSCRTVVLLHPEWNPAMVEQQIGRVDRVDSLWGRELTRAIAENVDPDSLPRIDIRGIVFSGTYDELNWEVLKKRWDDLRAQLHGIVIPPSEMPTDEEGLKITSEIAKLMPRFSPPLNW